MIVVNLLTQVSFKYFLILNTHFLKSGQSMASWVLLEKSNLILQKELPIQDVSFHPSWVTQIWLILTNIPHLYGVGLEEPTQII